MSGGRGEGFVTCIRMGRATWDVLDRARALAPSQRLGLMLDVRYLHW